MFRTITLAFLATLAVTSAQAAAQLNIQDFDPACGQPQHNCRTALQKAFQAAVMGGGGILQFPAGTFFVDFPEVADNTQSGPALQRQNLLLVPPNLTIRGHIDATSLPDTILEWRVTSIPVLVFANVSNSAIKDMHLRFTGTTPRHYPYGDVALLTALGFQPTFPHQNQMSGGNDEMSAFAYLFGSDHCIFDNLVFDSARQDNEHVMGFAINAKGSGVFVSNGGGGLTGLAAGNRFSNIKLFDYVMGMLISGQDGLLVENISGDRRGSTSSIAPGHLIYFTGTSLFKTGAESIDLASKNVIVRNVSEGSSTYSDVNALGTLAIKYIDGGTFQNISSKHPIGLIQTFLSVQNLSLKDLTWSSNSACDSHVARFCGVPVVESADNKPSDRPIEKLVFENLSLQSGRFPVTIDLRGSDIVVDGITIKTPPTFCPGQTAATAVFSLNHATSTTVRNFTYVPVLSVFDPKAPYNAPFTCWGQCSNVHADILVEWPKSVAAPPNENRIVAPSFQVKNADDNNSASIRIQSR